MNLRHSIAAVTLSVCLQAQADSSLTLGADYWRYTPTGTVRYQSTDPADDIDIHDELGYGDDQLASLYLQLEHPVPLLPALRIASLSANDSASGQLTRSVDFGGSQFLVGEAVDSRVRYRQSDVILYYNLFDTLARLDLGLDARHIDTRVDLNGSLTGPESASASGWVPMLYARTGLNLPLTGLAIEADGAFAGYGGDRLYQLDVRASYTSRWHAGASVGWRRIALELKEFDSTWADIRLDGPYAGLFVDF